VRSGGLLHPAGALRAGERRLRGGSRLRLAGAPTLYVYIYRYIHIYVYKYIYIYIEREIDSNIYALRAGKRRLRGGSRLRLAGAPTIYIYIYIDTYIYMYMNIYI